MRTFITFFLALSTIFSYSQIAIGGGFELEDGDSGIQIRADIPVSDALSITPYLTYFFPDKFEDFEGDAFKLTFTSIGSDLHYNFEVGDKFKLYPLVGLSYDIYSLKYENRDYSEFDVKDSELNFNIGGGASYSLSDNLRLYAEPKYRGQIEGISLDVGVIFNL